MCPVVLVRKRQDSEPHILADKSVRCADISLLLAANEPLNALLIVHIMAAYVAKGPNVAWAIICAAIIV